MHNINTLYDHSILVLLQYWTKKLNCICWVLPACIVLVRTKPFMANWGEIEVKLKQKRPIWFSVVRPGVAPLQTCKSAAKTRKLASREYKQKWGPREERKRRQNQPERTLNTGNLLFYFQRFFQYWVDYVYSGYLRTIYINDLPSFSGSGLAQRSWLADYLCYQYPLLTNLPINSIVIGKKSGVGGRRRGWIQEA